MFQQNLYDAYTGISFFKKNAIVQFFRQNMEQQWVEDAALLKAVEYATKEIPSFGGFILTAEKKEKIVAALVVNKTGLAGIMPEFVAVLQATDKRVAKNKPIVRKLEEKAITLAQGDISLLIKDFGPRELLMENMLPEAKFRAINAKTKKLVKTKASA